MYNSYFGFQKAPFGVTPDASLFYTNPLNSEAFAALRYGIEAKKGLILITGEVGTGKTTLLRKLMRSLEVTTHCVFIFHTHLNFTELLRLILRDLGLAEKGKTRVRMIDQLNDYVIDQSRKGHIVSLLIDEAQNLSDRTLESLRLISNLESANEKLLQIVLTGQPELERKLAQPRLRQLKQRVALHCRLAPLNGNEVGPYIDFRLQAAGYEGKELFDPDAVEQIAFYSGGIPRLINMICDNALLIAYASAKKQVAAAMVHEAARDLRLGEPSQVKVGSQAKEFGTTEGKEPVSQAPTDEVVDELWQAASKELEMRKARRPRRLRQGDLLSPGIGILLALGMLGAAGAALYPLQTKNHLSNLAANIEDFIQGKNSGETLEEEPADEMFGAQAPAHQELPLLTESPNQDASSFPEAEKPGESQASVPTVEDPAPRIASKPPDEISQAHESEIKRIESKISKAIRNRAIQGIDVSFVNGTAYLDGQVATQRQRAAAEQGARSVPGVERVRNRIKIVRVLTPQVIVVIE